MPKEKNFSVETEPKLDEDEDFHEQLEKVREKSLPNREDKMMEEEIVGDDEEDEDLSNLDYATIDDLDLSELLKEIWFTRYPDFTQVVHDNFKWDSAYFPKKYLTDKKVGFRRMTVRDQDRITKRVANLVQTKGGFRKAKKGDYNETALMLEKCYIVDPNDTNKKLSFERFQDMPLVQFLWMANSMLRAQGFSVETFENLRGELTGEEVA